MKDPSLESVKPSQRPSKSNLIAWVVIIALIAIAWNINLGSQPKPTILMLQATYPLRLHVMMENGTDTTALRGSYDIAVAVLQQMLGNEDIASEYSTFPDDGVKLYDFGNQVTYAPAGHKPWNLDAIIASKTVDTYMVHHDGSFGKIRAFNEEALNVFVGDHNVDPLDTARVILHELAHGWGLPHNPCSPIMHSVNTLTPSRIPPRANLNVGWLVDGIDVFSETVNGTLISHMQWGSPVIISLNRTSISGPDYTGTRDVYLFRSADETTYTQVIRTHTKNLSESQEWDSVEFSALNLLSYTRGWSPRELWFIEESKVGVVVKAPQPAEEC